MLTPLSGIHEGVDRDWAKIDRTRRMHGANIINVFKVGTFLIATGFIVLLATTWQLISELKQE